MFLVKYFIDAFKYEKLLVPKDKTFFKLTIYFIIMILISTFPLTYEAVKHEGSRLNFIIEDFNKIPSWNNPPKNFEIKGGKLLTFGSNDKYEFSHQNKTYIINGSEEDLNLLDVVILYESKIVYIDSKGRMIEGYNYNGFTDIFKFRNLDFANEEEKAILYKEFAKGMEKSFADKIVLFTIIRNVGVQLMINILYVLILSLLVQLYKFGYQKFMTYKDSFKFVILAVGPAAVFAFLIGLLAPAFSPLAFQVVSGLIVMMVPLIFGKKIYS